MGDEIRHTCRAGVGYQNKYSIFSDMKGLFPKKFILKESVGHIKSKKHDRTLTNIILVDHAQGRER